MNLDDLKVEAHKHGYRLIKANPYIKLLPCTCGRKRLELWYHMGGNGMYFACPVCGREGMTGKTERQARQYWNDCVSRMEVQDETNRR